MAVPKKKLSSSRRDSRRAHDFLENPQVSTCSNCGESKKPHCVCRHCGFYDGKQYKVVSEE
ncbi:MAG: 50S ribosomal protein L32 [uncultured bacterium]|nr:MAG: 50S ribosomal protein L32 [uncultured bacterium]